MPPMVMTGTNSLDGSTVMGNGTFVIEVMDSMIDDSLSQYSLIGGR